MMRYHKKCEEFSICCEVGQAGVIFLENSIERRTLYQIIVKGAGRMAKIFESDYILADTCENNFLDFIYAKNTVHLHFDLLKYIGYSRIELDIGQYFTLTKNIFVASSISIRFNTTTHSVEHSCEDMDENDKNHLNFNPEVDSFAHVVAHWL